MAKKVDLRNRDGCIAPVYPPSYNRLPKHKSNDPLPPDLRPIRNLTNQILAEIKMENARIIENAEAAIRFFGIELCIEYHFTNGMDNDEEKLEFSKELSKHIEALQILVSAYKENYANHFTDTKTQDNA